MGVTHNTILGLTLTGVLVGALLTAALPAFAVQRMPLMEQFVGAT